MRPPRSCGSPPEVLVPAGTRGCRRFIPGVGPCSDSAKGVALAERPVRVVYGCLPWPVLIGVSTVAVKGRRGGRGRDRVRSLMGSVLDRPGEREAQARVLVERLREEAERVAGALAAADESLSRLVITRETVAEVLDSESDESTDAGVAPDAAVRGMGRDVALYERITRTFAEAGAAMRPRQVCEALGMSAEARFIEAMRPKLARLAADRVLVQVGRTCLARVASSGQRARTFAFCFFSSSSRLS